jgi:hypothetical protein
MSINHHTNLVPPKFKVHQDRMHAQIKAAVIQLIKGDPQKLSKALLGNFRILIAYHCRNGMKLVSPRRHRLEMLDNKILSIKRVSELWWQMNYIGASFASTLTTSHRELANSWEAWGSNIFITGFHKHQFGMKVEFLCESLLKLNLRSENHNVMAFNLISSFNGNSSYSFFRVPNIEYVRMKGVVPGATLSLP